MPQYFDNDQTLGHKDYAVRFEMFGERYSLKSDIGVFSKGSLDDGTRLLLETIAQAELGEDILDVGCGIGPIGLILSRTDPKRHVTMIDVNLRALELARANVAAYGLSSRVQIIESDVYNHLEPHSIYDCIVTNPPIRAGKKVTYMIYDEAPSRLKDNGKLIVVIRKKQGAPSCYRHLQTLFNKVEIAASKKGYQVLVATK